jgi:hypothetical protein
MLRETMDGYLWARLTADQGYGARTVPSGYPVVRVSFLDPRRADGRAFWVQCRFGALVVAACGADVPVRSRLAAKLA